MVFDRLGNDSEVQELKFKFLMGEISYDELEKLEVRYSDFSNNEQIILQVMLKNIEKLYKADILSKEHIFYKRKITVRFLNRKELPLR